MGIYVGSGVHLKDVKLINVVENPMASGSFTPATTQNTVTISVGKPFKYFLLAAQSKVTGNSESVKATAYIFAKVEGAPASGSLKYAYIYTSNDSSSSTLSLSYASN